MPLVSSGGAERAAEYDGANVASEDAAIEAERERQRERRRKLSANLLTAAASLLDDEDSLRANPHAVSRAIAIALAESRAEFGGTTPASADASELEFGGTMPLVRVVFERSDSNTVAAVIERPMDEEAPAMLAAAEPAADAGAMPPARASNGFVFRRS